MTPHQIAEKLELTGLCVCRDFLSPDERVAIRTDFDRIYASGAFHRAAVGQGTQEQVIDQIRNDETFWLDSGETTVAAQNELLVRCDQLKTSFNRTLFLGLNEFEGHYAAYPAGGFYQRHRDSFAGDPSRIVSLVIYLNENWKTEDGGQLRVFLNNTHVDIEPMAGTLVCFMSQETEHEVLPSHAPRRSFAGWFKRPS